MNSARDVGLRERRLVMRRRLGGAYDEGVAAVERLADRVAWDVLPLVSVARVPAPGDEGLAGADEDGDEGEEDD